MTATRGPRACRCRQVLPVFRHLCPHQPTDLIHNSGVGYVGLADAGVVAAHRLGAQRVRPDAVRRADNATHTGSQDGGGAGGPSTCWLTEAELFVRWVVCRCECRCVWCFPPYRIDRCYLLSCGVASITYVTDLCVVSSIPVDVLVCACPLCLSCEWCGCGMGSTHSWGRTHGVWEWPSGGQNIRPAHTTE